MSQVSLYSTLLRSSRLVLVAVGFGMILACGKTTNALVVVEQASVEKKSSQVSTVLQALAEADVIYLGERHDRPEDHAAQLEIIQAMHQNNPDVAIALEMFQRPFQNPLDQYIAGELDESQMIQQTEYLQRWGFPWDLYAPIMRYAKQHQIPLLALNTPSEVSRKIARSGLDSLEGDELKYIPDPNQIDTSNEAYRAYVGQAFGGHGAHGHFDFENFFAAQVTWDETMAEAIAQYKNLNPQSQVIVLAGRGHVVYGHGIPDRVQRRLGPDLKQQIVLLNDSSPALNADIADILWNGFASTPNP